MALFTIKEGAHYHALPPISTLPWMGKRQMSRTVTFDANCQYDSPAYNSEDVNKLFGLSFGFGGVHRNSARFGWRWSKADQCIELLAYCYLDGKRNQDEQLRFPVVAQVKPGQKAQCFVGFQPNDLLVFSVRGEHNEPLGWYAPPVAYTTMGKSYGLTHGPYFGGSLPAPHELTIRLTR